MRFLIHSRRSPCLESNFSLPDYYFAGSWTHLPAIVAIRLVLLLCTLHHICYHPPPYFSTRRWTYKKKVANDFVIAMIPLIHNYAFYSTDRIPFPFLAPNSDQADRISYVYCENHILFKAPPFNGHFNRVEWGHFNSTLWNWTALRLLISNPILSELNLLWRVDRIRISFQIRIGSTATFQFPRST